MSRGTDFFTRTAGFSVLLLLITGCHPGPDPPAAIGEPNVRAIFTDQAKARGLEFEHVNGMSGELYFIEPVGTGGAFFDYDNDGDLDVYLVQGGALPPNPESKTEGLRDKLFRNDLDVAADGSRSLSFTDVTAESGLDARIYGMGVATGDYDNDGFVDLYVTGFGETQLWQNRGDGTFIEVSAEAGTRSSGWNTSAAFVDVDHDGWLDLFLVRYVDYRLAAHAPCHSPSGRPDYCGPHGFAGTTDRLFRNLGPDAEGRVTFADISREAGLGDAASSGLGVVSSDFDRDGRTDLYVANDLRRNFLWMGSDDGRFENRALLAGAAVRGDGRAEASMGVVAGDVDNDGDEDLFLTHLMTGTNTLYLNNGRGHFADSSSMTRLDSPSLGFTGFGTAFLDYDNDGWLDLVSANGSVNRIEALLRAGDPYPLGQSNQLFRNLGPQDSGPAFEEVTATAGDSFAQLEVSRGLATGDVDNDGDADVLLINNHGPARLLINQVGHEGNWLGVRLVTSDSGRDALGAEAVLQRADGLRLARRARTDGSYCSANDPRLLFGLGESPATGLLRVTWPSGRVEEWDDLAPHRYHSLVEGQGHPAGEPSP